MQPFSVVLLGICGTSAVMFALADPLQEFVYPEADTIVANATLLATIAKSAPDCAAKCTAFNSTMCNAFSFEAADQQCVMSTYSPHFATAPAQGWQYYRRIQVLDYTPVSFVAPPKLESPVRNVTLGSGRLRDAFNANIDFLLGHEADDILYFFRERAGDYNPPGQCFGWDGGLRGSVSGLFMMGSGGVLRWEEHDELRARLEAVVKGIAQAQEPSGYAMAFHYNVSWMHENPDYVTSWVTHGLLQAARAGVDGGVDVLRRHFDFFENCSSVPRYLPPNTGPTAAPPPRGWTTNFTTGFGAAQGHEIYLIYQGQVAFTSMAKSVVGRQSDWKYVRDLMQETWWLESLKNKELSAIWQRHWFSHNYETTAFISYMDLYYITGDSLYLDAMLGAWSMLREHWVHVGGSVAINEAYYYPPDSYYLDYTETSHNSLPAWASSHHHHHHPRDDAWEQHAACKGPALDRDHPSHHDHSSHQHGIAFPGGSLPSVEDVSDFQGHPTGELCGSSFWIIFNQQLHALFPENETFATEIERSILNVGLANPARNGSEGIRYFALLHKNKQTPTNHATCCEGQGTRLLGSVPEHLLSYGPKGVYWDLYFSSESSWDLGTHGGPGPDGYLLKVNVSSGFPYSGRVVMKVWVEPPAREADHAGVTSGSLPTSIDVDFALRIPSWSQGTVDVSVNGAAVRHHGTRSGAGGFVAGRARHEGLDSPGNNDAGNTNGTVGGSLSSHAGTPGTYLHLEGSWPVGRGPSGAATVTFDLNMGWRVTKYAGLTSVPGHDRWAYEYGPVLMAMTGAWDKSLGKEGVEHVQGPGLDPERPGDWAELDPTLGGPLQFRVKGAKPRDGKLVTLMPYMDVKEEIFDVYSVVEASG